MTSTSLFSPLMNIDTSGNEAPAISPPDFSSAAFGGRWGRRGWRGRRCWRTADGRYVCRWH